MLFFEIYSEIHSEEGAQAGAVPQRWAAAGWREGESRGWGKEVPTVAGGRAVEANPQTAIPRVVPCEATAVLNKIKQKTTTLFSQRIRLKLKSDENLTFFGKAGQHGISA